MPVAGHDAGSPSQARTSRSSSRCLPRESTPVTRARSSTPTPEAKRRVPRSRQPSATGSRVGPVPCEREAQTPYTLSGAAW
ncbi:hypothetical protein BJF82_00310 [Kytococcus sp. CUA-901]|nr:hypothetical protein BJF82_00310 [Kytococcus sp. CUA-901]